MKLVLMQSTNNKEIFSGSWQIRWRSFSLWCLVALLLGACQNAPGTRPVYGNDSREEMILAGPLMCRVGSATAAIFNRDVLQLNAVENRWEYSTLKNLAASGWCDDERFATQDAQAFCTTFLIAPDRVATAGHCVQPPDDSFAPGLSCDQLLVVFDYRLGQDGRAPNSFPAKSVYTCEEVLAGEDSGNGPDWRVLKLDRAAQRDPLPLYQGKPLVAKTPVIVAGHPLGLPMKQAKGITLASGSSTTLTTNLDAFIGNSGSPVVVRRGDRLLVAGVLIGGQADSNHANPDQACRRTIVCSDLNACNGEQASISSPLLSWTDDIENRKTARGTLEVPCAWCDDPLRSHHWQCHKETS